jgi:hypothetical protein
MRAASGVARPASMLWPTDCPPSTAPLAKDGWSVPWRGSEGGECVSESMCVEVIVVFKDKKDEEIKPTNTENEREQQQERKTQKDEEIRPIQRK